MTPASLHHHGPYRICQSSVHRNRRKTSINFSNLVLKRFQTWLVQPSTGFLNFDCKRKKWWKDKKRQMYKTVYIFSIPRGGSTCHCETSHTEKFCHTQVAIYQNNFCGNRNFHQSKVPIYAALQFRMLGSASREIANKRRFIRRRLILCEPVALLWPQTIILSCLSCVVRTVWLVFSHPDPDWPALFLCS